MEKITTIQGVNKLKQIIVLVFIITSLSGKEFSSLKYSGFGLDVGENGSGLSYNRTWFKNKKLYFVGELRVFDAKHPDEIVMQDYYTGRAYKFNNINLVLFPLFSGVKYYPFVGKIANNFSPFFSIKFGPILVLDGAETGSFKQKWYNNVQYYRSWGGSLGLGADVLTSNNTILTVRVGYDMLPMSQEIDGRDDYSGALVRFGFNWKK